MWVAAKPRLDLNAWQLGVLSRWYALRRQGLLRELSLNLVGHALKRMALASIVCGFATVEWEPIEWSEADRLIQAAEATVESAVTTQLPECARVWCEEQRLAS